jgi:hypothetical protein
MKTATRPQYHRLQRILELIREGTRTGSRPNCDHFIGELEVSRRPETSNSQQPTANSQQPTTSNSQQPTANSQHPTSNIQQPMRRIEKPPKATWGESRK